LLKSLTDPEGEMAKAKSKSSNKGTGMPKKVAGVKVPKAVRQSKSLGTLLNSGLGREILADALIAAAGAAAAALTRTRPVRNAGRAVAETGSEAASATSDAVQTAAGAVAGVVTEAGRSFLPASLVGVEEPASKPRYVHRAADHSERKRSSKDGKSTKRIKRAKKKDVGKGEG
jgi:hypothetical protein